MAFGRLKQFAEQHRIPTVVISLAVIGAIVDGLKGFSVTWSAIQWLIQKGTSFDVNSAVVSPEPWFGVLLIFVLAVAAVGLALYGYAYIQLIKTQKELTAAREELAGTARRSKREVRCSAANPQWHDFGCIKNQAAKYPTQWTGHEFLRGGDWPVSNPQRLQRHC